MDVLRGYVNTTLFGEEISNTSKETWFMKEYTYSATQLKDVIPVKDDMKVAVWMTQDQQFSEIITATETEVAERAVGINEATSLEGLNIYPNPFVSNATIEFNLETSQYIGINVYDVTGKVVQSFPSTVYSSGNHKLNVEGNNLEGGLYYVNIVAEDGIITRKLILNK